MSHMEHFYTLFNHFPTFIQAAILVIFIATAGSLITYIAILKIRLIGFIKEKRNKVISSRIDDTIIEHIVSNQSLLSGGIDNLELPLSHFQQFNIKNKNVRRLLVRSLLYYHQVFGGKVRFLLSKLYKDLNLQQYALEKLYGGSSLQKINELKELQRLAIDVPEPVIHSLLNGKKSNERAIARKYLFQQDKIDAFVLFDNITERLTGWEELELFQLIIKKSRADVPDFANWIKSGINPSVLSLSMRLVVYFQQFNAVHALLELLQASSDMRLNCKLINALGKLEQEEAEESLLNRYEEAVLDEKIEILKALGRIGSGKRLDFLQHILETEQSIVLRKHAAKSIVKYEHLASGRVQHLKASATGLNRIILGHVTNPLIKY
ncbi:MAG: HEAT repeat domain-containing protein [Olivibacter sp.]|nr:HEAT repeat domain-containing protein [Olivibacter sp. UJ_SKK_5.1]